MERALVCSSYCAFQVDSSAIDTTGKDEAAIIASYEARVDELRGNLIYRIHKKSFVADLVIYKDMVSGLCKQQSKKGKVNAVLVEKCKGPKVALGLQGDAKVKP